MTKQECLENQYYDEEYFVLEENKDGFLAFFDRETGEEVHTTPFKKIKRGK